MLVFFGLKLLLNLFNGCVIVTQNIKRGVKMAEKKKKLIRINLQVAEETKERLEALAEKSDRSMTGVIENLIKVEYHRVKENGARWVP